MKFTELIINNLSLGETELSLCAIEEMKLAACMALILFREHYGRTSEIHPFNYLCIPHPNSRTRSVDNKVSEYSGLS